MPVAYFLIRQRTGLDYLDHAVTRMLNVVWESALLPWLFILLSVILYHTDRASHVVFRFQLLNLTLNASFLVQRLQRRPILCRRFW